MRRSLLVLLVLGIASAIFSGTTATVAVWGKSTSACVSTSSDDDDDGDTKVTFQRATLKLKRLYP